MMHRAEVGQLFPAGVPSGYPLPASPGTNAKGGADATPVGTAVTAPIELVSVEGWSLLFKVACHDEAGLIGEGTHRRAIIDAARFLEKLKVKQASGKT